MVGTRFPFAPNWRYLFSDENKVQERSESGPVIGDNVLLSDDLKPEFQTKTNRKRPLVETTLNEPVSKKAKTDNVLYLPTVIRHESKLKELSQLIGNHGSGKLVESVTTA